MKKLLNFKTKAEYNAATEGGGIETPCVIYVKEDDSSICKVGKTISENDLPGPYVDIAGIQWASCNLGAEKPCDYGDYYMWGSTTPNTNDDCSWKNAPFNNGSSSYDSSYFATVKDTVCPNNVLADEYDAIQVATDGFARMPTQAEFQSLYNNTNREVCYCDTALGHSGHTKVYGMLFTSKTNSDNKIFIPFSGYRNGSLVNGTGGSAYLWSSSLNSGSTQYAYNLLCSNTGRVNPSSSNNRYYGFALRGVKNVKS